MQSINRVILGSSFIMIFLATALLCTGLGIYAVIAWQQPGSGRLLAACLLYFFGTFVLTMVANVPRNTLLDAADPATIESAHLWMRYLREWTLWNHVRTAAAIVALVLFAGWD